MGYTGGSLADLVKKSQDAVNPAIRQMVDDGGARMTEITKRNTPVGQPDPDGLGPPPGHLRDSVSQKPVVQTVDGWESGAETDVYYGPFVEEGTGLWGPEHREYIIRPKDPNGVLRFYAQSVSSTGGITHSGPVYARFVMHPGSPGQHMFAIGVELTEAEFSQVTASGLEQWRARSLL